MHPSPLNSLLVFGYEHMSYMDFLILAGFDYKLFLHSPGKALS